MTQQALRAFEAASLDEPARADIPTSARPGTPTVKRIEYNDTVVPWFITASVGPWPDAPKNTRRWPYGFISPPS